jgi:hypothetical protein
MWAGPWFCGQQAPPAPRIRITLPACMRHCIEGLDASVPGPPPPRPRSLWLQCMQQLAGHSTGWPPAWQRGTGRCGAPAAVCGTHRLVGCTPARARFHAWRKRSLACNVVFCCLIRALAFIRAKPSCNHCAGAGECRSGRREVTRAVLQNAAAQKYTLTRRFCRPVARRWQVTWMSDPCAPPRFDPRCQF